MNEAAKISHTAALILQTVSSGYMYGFDIMEVTGLPSGTVYPALRRLEQEELINGSWEDGKEASSKDRPRRRYYRLTKTGKDALGSVMKRYPLLAQLSPERSGRR